jgi:hypothetical protein
VRKPTVLFAVACAALLAACSSGESSQQTANIAKVASVKSSFGPEFKVTELPMTGIDPKMLAAQKLPEGVKFDPADCAKFAVGPQFPDNIKGNMTAVSAEGAGNRFITIALETSEPIPVTAPADNCKKVSFAGGAVRGTVEVVPAPQIADVGTQAVHRVLQTTINGTPQTGEIYSYRANFGNYQVIVTANPLVVPGQPVAPVDTKRAESLLAAAVAAIKG